MTGRVYNEGNIIFLSMDWEEFELQDLISSLFQLWYAVVLPQ